MKRTDIRAGVVYAVKASYGAPSPVVFLEDGAAGLYQRRSQLGRNGPPFVQVTEDKHTKAKRGTGWSGVTYGYAVVIASWTARGDGDAAAALRAVDATAELEHFRSGGSPASDLLQFDLMTSLTRIAPWDEAVAEHEAAGAAEEKRREDADARRTRVGAAVAALREYGIRARASGDDIEISAEEAERLLSLLSGNAEG